MTYGQRIFCKNEHPRLRFSYSKGVMRSTHLLEVELGSRKPLVLLHIFVVGDLPVKKLTLRNALDKIDTPMDKNSSYLMTLI